ncbi:MAG TPA: Trx7/PDZ domain-containing (seleno)protein [Planctomycetaceae bacterium]|nr:Trx7/PDZ domain-containing (seleno)protein [Planctomycetaceae bacterium]
MLRLPLLCSLLICLCSNSLSAQTRLEKVLEDRKKVLEQGFWLYNSLDAGLAEAKKSGKPMLVVLRCIPCDECVKLDEELMEQDPHLKPLLEKFVRVRIVGTNGLDLSLFQFDYDQSFAVFLMNADKTIYGRYGTRSDRISWEDDVSIEGLARALEGTLELHANYPANKEQFAGKRGPKPMYASPEKFPSLASKFTSELDYKGDVVKSCIHCHQVGDAQREVFRAARKPMPEEILFPYPHPKILGLILSPKEKATIKEIAPFSVAESSGFKAGDEILSLDGQPLLSIADVQWVLHNAGDKEALTAHVQRAGEQIDLTLPLESGWRSKGDISWRSTSWPLRRMGLGGMKLAELSDKDRPSSLRDSRQMALLVQHVGQYGPHAAAKNAGVQKDDILISFDNRTDLLRETDLLVYAATHTKPGDRIPVTLLRNGKKIELKLPMQE